MGISDLEKSIRKLEKQDITVIPIAVTRECHTAMSEEWDDGLCPNTIVLNKLAGVGRNPSEGFYEMKSRSTANSVIEELKDCKDEIAAAYTAPSCNNCTCECELPLGPRGPKGETGEPTLGETGDKGLTGGQGYPGESGIKGYKGYTGRRGRRGNQGDEGFKGYKGSTGVRGYPGLEGRRGDIGSKGIEGEVGPKGNQGQKGRIGEPGDPGRTGRNGRDGIPGIPGDKGRVGYKGAPGVDVTGPDGDSGPNGPRGEVGRFGPNGDDGPDGRHGDCGQPGQAGPQGQRGPPGYKGDEGVKGEKGYEGLPGEPGLQGRTGPRGAQGETGVQGEKGEPNFERGPSGFSGLSGPLGPRGIKGPDGLDGREGPRGNAGPKGPQGEPGVAGNFDYDGLRPFIREIVKDLIPKDCLPGGRGDTPGDITEKCEGVMEFDLMFVNDESASIGGYNYPKSLNFMNEVLKGFKKDINAGNVGVGVLTYGEISRLQIPLGKYSYDTLSNRITNLPYANGRATMTGEAITRATRHMVDNSPSTRPRYIMVITDGESAGSPPKDASDAARAQGIELIAVGINDYNIDELMDIAGGDRNAVKEVQDFDALAGIAEEVSQTICGVAARSSIGRYRIKA